MILKQVKIVRLIASPQGHMLERSQKEKLSCHIAQESQKGDEMALCELRLMAESITGSNINDDPGYCGPE